MSEEVDAWYQGALAAAEVEVDEEWGTGEVDPIPLIVPPPELQDVPEDE